ncbi:thioredoxin-dependent thiol peroxidase [Candidatus Pelagibacter communis]|uniref:thioredoxin-dependent thiol peroxidase n=1 Tax=Pelagibacter ubique TaxID=198252 RepID=UPI00094D57F7|nr:thioredoxin-dependent thiol peroxidase [Candidatus Pelagibacter ubique]|tara:strand:- start:499 stop:999 length:501 start_codon:yes stop_codon:yes gene_type:complete
MKLNDKMNIRAPDFTLPSTNDKNFKLKDFIGKYIVIYFYPKDNTPGCTLETIEFNKLLEKFKKLKCEVIGISKDSIISHKKFKKKNKIKFDLLSDEKLKVIKKYKVWGRKQFMGREFMGIKRSTILVSKKGRILRFWENVKVKGHAKEVLETIENLRKIKKAPKGL